MITLRAFNIYPAQAYQLQCKGTLPERRRGEVTLEFVAKGGKS